MDSISLPPEEFFEGTPPHVRAYIEQLHATIANLQSRVAELEAKLAKNSTNSSLPPSTEPPHAKPLRSTAKSSRRHGGQHGHAKRARLAAQRAMPAGHPLPTDRLPPLRCPAERLRSPTPTPAGLGAAPDQAQRHRIPTAPADLPLRHAHLWRLARRRPQRTGRATPDRLQRPFDVLLPPVQEAGRPVLEHDPRPASPGWMVSLQELAAQAVQPAYDELVCQLPEEPLLSIDESPSKEGRSKSWIWTFVAAAFTLFASRRSRAADILADWLGETYAGVIHCDRARMYWSFGRLQWCWAHLKRDFQGLIDSSSPTAQRLGRHLMRATEKLFALWQKVRDGTLSRPAFREHMEPIRAEVESLLLRGYFDARVHGFCKGLWEHRENLWAFVEVEGAEPTNNAAEQALRQAVIWRKLSFGTPSAGGSRFVERLLTVVETCRRQKRDVFGWLVASLAQPLHLSCLGCKPLRWS